MSGMMMKTYTKKDRKLLMKMSYEYIRNKIETCIVWSPTKHVEISQREFRNTTGKMEGMEHIS